ncbi:MAG TPA: hypothetical protein VGR11_12675, partial [Solirubrobacteraceae bacterium]|nr:hypothetical protein [Solirubrobacteraceae bacterium]
MRRGRIILWLAVAAALCATGTAAAAATKTMRIALPSEDGSLTPYTFESGYAFMTLVYDTLTWRDADGIPKPWLARSIRRDATGLTVDVQLRRGVRWHDGRR